MKQKGFTLIELLIVITIVGILAGATLTLLNPIEQFRRARDSQRQQAINMLVKGMNSFYTTNNSSYPAGTTSWITALKNNKDIDTVPDQIGGSAVTCADNNQNNFCYAGGGAGTPQAAVYTFLEASSYRNAANCGAGTNPAWVWRSSTGTVKVECLNPASAITLTP